MNEVEQGDCDIADDNLQRIIDDKRELLDFILGMARRHEVKSKDISDLAELVSEQYDDIFHGLYHKLLEASGSIGWPLRIPPYEALSFVTPKQRADHEWRKRNRSVRTNPGSYDRGDLCE